MSSHEKDLFFMREALQEAKKAFSQGEVPVGAVLVLEDKIIARSHNQVETLQDASCHAELLCLRLGAALLRNWRLAQTTLYCTLEPCSMCWGALTLSRVHTLVWGAPDRRYGVLGSWLSLQDTPHPIHQLAVRGRVLEEESSALMIEFFRKVRKEKNGPSSATL